MPAASTYKLSVQVSDFESLGLLIQLARLVCDFCSSGQRFAHSFLQIPPRGGHPCRSANGSPCRVHRRLSLPSECALPGAPKKAARSSLRTAENFRLRKSGSASTPKGFPRMPNRAVGTTAPQHLFLRRNQPLSDVWAASWVNLLIVLGNL